MAASFAREVASLTPADVTGRLWDVHAIESGLSSNRNDWLEETLMRDGASLDGIPIRVTWKALDHHDEVGILRGAEGAHVGGKVVVRGQAEITDEQAQREMLRAFLAKDPYELSIDTPIRAVEAIGPDGKRVSRVLAIRRTDRTELTIVKRGAAGGRLMRAVAGEGEASSASEFAIERGLKLAEAILKADEAERRAEAAGASLDRAIDHVRRALPERSGRASP